MAQSLIFAVEVTDYWGIKGGHICKRKVGRQGFSETWVEQTYQK